MNKILKFFAYIATCAALFLVLAKAFNSDTAPTGSVVGAFDWEKPVQIYLVDRAMAETSNCEADISVTRMVLNAETLGPGALAALIEGPKGAESEKYYSAINPATLIKKFEVINSVAHVDLSSDLNANIVGSCNVIAVRSQIENTLNTLPDIDSVILSVDGQTTGILEP